MSVPSLTLAAVTASFFTFAVVTEFFFSCLVPTEFLPGDQRRRHRPPATGRSTALTSRSRRSASGASGPPLGCGFRPRLPEGPRPSPRRYSSSSRTARGAALDPLLIRCADPQDSARKVIPSSVSDFAVIGAAIARVPFRHSRKVAVAVRGTARWKCARRLPGSLLGRPESSP